MEQECLYDLLAEVILLINDTTKNLDFQSLTIESVQAANDGVIKACYTNSDIVFALKHICDDENGTYLLNRTKLEKALILSALNKKSDGYRLSEFVSVVKQAYDIGIPQNLNTSLMDLHENAFDPKLNLFEHYKDLDLSSVAGQAIIIPYAHQRVHERNTSAQDDIIMALNPYFHPELVKCMENIEQRIEVLFKIKEKWTARELKSLLQDFCEPEIDAKFDLWLNKNSRTIKGQNPYD